MFSWLSSKSSKKEGKGKGTDAYNTEALEANRLKRLNGYHSLARDTVSRAVTYEETGKANEAVAHYKQALRVITEAFSMGKVDGEEAEKKENELASWHQRSSDRIKQIEGRARSRSAGASPFKPVLPSTRGPSRQRSSPALRSAGAPTTSATARSRAPPRSPEPAQPPPVPGPRQVGAKSKAKDDLRSMIQAEILDSSPGVGWDDIAGLDKAKQLLREMVILPATRPDLFKGLRAPTRGLLLYGPPGNGKTMLAKAVASESTCTFFAISASTLTSKWVGDSEKLVRALFEVANEREPSIIFIDEIDSVLSARSANENESSRRLKTEFLIQFDGVNKTGNQVFVIGASNRPEELDDAVRRRLAKRIHIPLPDDKGRETVLSNLLKGQSVRISRSEWTWLVSATKGYSASDIKELCHEAAMMAIRELSPSRIETVSASAVRPITAKDFEKAWGTIKASVSADQLDHYDKWTRDFGTGV